MTNQTEERLEMTTVNGKEKDKERRSPQAERRGWTLRADKDKPIFGESTKRDLFRDRWEHSP